MSFKKLRKTVLPKVEKRQQRLVDYGVAIILKAQESGINQVVENFSVTGRYKDPNLDKVDALFLDFYERIVTSSIFTAQETARQQMPKKLSKHEDMGLPKGVRKAREVIKDKRFWRRLKKRADRASKRYKQRYLKELRKKFAQIIPAFQRGDLTIKEIKDNLQANMRFTKSRAETVFRTEVTNYYANAQVAYFEEEEAIIGFIFDAVRDSGSTSICRQRHGLIYRPNTKLLTKNTPSLHYNCRSHLIPLANTAQNRKMLLDPSRDPTKKKVPPLPKGWRN